MFEITEAEQIIIDNANRLMQRWDPKNPATARLHMTTMQTIEVYPDNDSSYLEDLLTLNIFFEDFTQLIKKRIQAISKPENPDLQKHYELSQLYLGLRLLNTNISDILYEKVDVLKQNVLAASTLNKSDRKPINKVLNELNTSLISLLYLQLEIAANHKINLFDVRMVEQGIYDPTGLRAPLFSSSYRLINKLITLSEFEHNHINYEIVAQLQASFSSKLQTGFSFSNITRFSLLENNELVPVCMAVYPRWVEFNYHDTPITLPEFETCKEGANDRFSKCENMSYTLPQLAVTLTGQFAESKQLPLFFQAMVEIAKNHHCYEIALFIPNNFVLKAHAFGFYSKDKTLQQSFINFIEEQLADREPVPLMPEEVNQFLNEHELMQPVYFSLQSLKECPVYLTERGVKTTYDELCRNQPLFDGKKTNGILPDFFNFLQKPFCSFYELAKKRALTGNMPSMTSCTLNKSITDANWLKKDNDLIAIGEASSKPQLQRTTSWRVLRQSNLIV